MCRVAIRSRSFWIALGIFLLFLPLFNERSLANAMPMRRLPNNSPNVGEMEESSGDNDGEIGTEPFKSNEDNGGIPEYKVDLYKNGNGKIKVPRGSILKIFCTSPDEARDTDRTEWMKDGKKMDTEKFARIVFTRFMITINKVSRKDKGLYECVIFGPNDEIRFRRNVIVKVPKKAKIVEEYEYVTDEEIHDAKVGCKTDEISRNTRKKLSNAPIQQDDRLESELSGITQGDSSSSGGSSDNMEDRGEPYLCFDLSDNERKMIHYFVKSAGTTVAIHCNAKGSSKFEVSWFKNGKPFTATGYQHKITADNSIILTDVTRNDEAVYTCRISNETVSLEYETLFIVRHRIASAPIFQGSTVNQTVESGANLTVDCKVIEQTKGYSYYNKFYFAPEGDNFTEVQSRTSQPLGTIDDHQILIDNVSFEDAGWYRCVAVNSIGKSERRFFVDIHQSVDVDSDSNVSDKTNKMASVARWVIPFLCSTLIIVIIGSCITCVMLLKITKNHSDDELTDVVVDQSPEVGNDDTSIAIATPEINYSTVVPVKRVKQYNLTLDPVWEFDRQKLRISSYLGEGAFGEVMHGTAEGIIQKDLITKVAVKKLKETHTEEQFQEFVKEMNIMKRLGRHINLISFLGCCTQDGELLVIMEVAENGSLKEYLRRNRHFFPHYTSGKVSQRVNPLYLSMDSSPLCFKDLMSFAYQIARGMEYISQKKFVHRDLAARNVLVSANKGIKIADFGMTRYLEEDYYRKLDDVILPVKWMSPEAILQRMYTTYSDVWSYGIVLWEIVTLAKTPYPGIDMNNFYKMIEDGYRMSKPPHCPDELFCVMHECWNFEPQSRPTFPVLVEEIGLILALASDQDYFKMENDYDKVPPIAEAEEEEKVKVTTPKGTPRNSQATPRNSQAVVRCEP